MQATRLHNKMYAQKFSVEIIVGQQRRPCPLDWLDSFCMRNFTGQAEFDDTLPTGDGTLEAGFRVSPQRLADALGAWFTQRGKGGGQAVLVEVSPEPQESSAGHRSAESNNK